MADRRSASVSVLGHLAHGHFLRLLPPDVLYVLLVDLMRVIGVPRRLRVMSAGAGLGDER